MKTSIPRIPPPIHFLVGLTTMILLNSFVPIGHWLVFPWRYTGIIIIVLGFSLAIGSGMFFRKFGTDPRPGNRAAVIVTNGPFRYTRNPMYFGYIIMLIGTSTLLGTLSPLIVIPIFFLILQTQFVFREEKWMAEWFGAPYLEYKKKTPRWLI